MPARKSDDQPATPFGLPRNLLVPYVLLFLKNVSAHGYQILQTLTMLGFATMDPATVYRALRQMEREGLVLSSWQTGTAGPARRTYQITPDGEKFLGEWAEALGAYQRFLDRFFNLYAAGGARIPDVAPLTTTGSAATSPDAPQPATSHRARRAKLSATQGEPA